MITKIKTWWANLSGSGETSNTTLPQDYYSQDNPVVYEEVEHEFNYSEEEGWYPTTKCTTEKETPVKKDISEPVLSFVVTVLRDNKDRFYLNRFNHMGDFLYYCYDKKLKKGYAIIVGFDRFGMQEGDLKLSGGKLKLQDTSFLTDEEIRFIYKELIRPVEDRKDRYVKLKKKRKERDQRSVLTKLYKENNNG